ncbi:MAG: GHKL domain-containing protein [Bdellovibrionaceae bacterium]|nr:GHKL domain-containing protein [Pseudobdellovibrionaceae bacterium]
MNKWHNFLTRLFDTRENVHEFSEPILTTLLECRFFFPEFKIAFWSVNVRKNEIKIYRKKGKQLVVFDHALSQFKFESLLRSRSRPYYVFETAAQKRVLIPLFVDNTFSGCLSIAAPKTCDHVFWQRRMPYFYIVAKRLLKVLEFNIRNNAIDTLMELNQNLEDKVQEKSLSLEQEKRAHMQAGKMATLGEVAVGIAHEINNPLTIVVSRVGSLEKNLAKKNLLNPDIAESIVKINQTIERIVKIINGLRHFAYSGDHRKTSTTLSKVISDSLELCQERLKKNDIALKVVKSVFDVEISVYDTQMIQVLLNLIINSLDAIKDLSDKWIEIEYKIQNDHLNIIVRDSGSGLAADVAAKIMNPFYTTKERGKGTGLGLSLSKSIVENHEGRLFYNADAKNTEFVIELPYMRLLNNEPQL